MYVMPGSRALVVLSRWFDEQCVSTVFEPLIADWQREWQHADGFTRIRVWVRGAAALFVSIIAASPNVLLAPSPTGTIRHVITRLTLWTAVMTALNVYPFATSLSRKFDIAGALYVTILLLPQAVAVAFPFAVATVVDLIRTAPRPTREERITAVRVALASCALLLLVDGWMYPAANQQYRVEITRAAMGSQFRRGPAPGKNELSIPELTRISLNPQRGDSFDRDYAVRELNRRVSMVFVPILFIWARWRALRLPRGKWYSPAPLIISVPLLCFCWYSLTFANVAIADIVYAPRWTGPWLSIAAMAIAAVGVDRLRRRGAGIA